MCLVTFIITNYNYSDFLEECVESCLIQNSDYEFEVLLVDDGSFDDSLAKVKKYHSRNFNIIQRPNSGIEKSSNIGFSHAQGRYVVRVDADDYLHNDYLKIMCPMINECVDFIYPDYILINDTGGKIKSVSLPEFDKAEILNRGDFLATGTMYKKSTVQAYGYYNDTVKNCGLENYELIVKMLIGGCVGKHINHELFSYRRHGENISNDKRESIIQYGEGLFDRLGIGEYQVNSNHPYIYEL